MSLPYDGRFVWSDDEERFPSGEGFETRELAVADAHEHVEPGARFWTGEVELFEPTEQVTGQDLAEWLVETLACRSGDLAGEAAEDYPSVDPSGRDLVNRCGAFLASELGRSEYGPDFYTVVGIQEHLAPGACRSCGCTDEDCSGCIERSGEPCHWVEPNLCSACAP